MCGVCYGQDIEKPINEKYSFKGFPYHGLSFKKIDPKEFNNTTIKGSCFYQEWLEGEKEVEKEIFPEGMTGVTFKGCNLDNVIVPIGNTVIGGTHKLIQVQNDWEDWVLEKKDGKLVAKEPMNKKLRIEKGFSVDVNDIPSEKWTQEEKKQYEEDFNNASIIATP